MYDGHCSAGSGSGAHRTNFFHVVSANGTTLTSSVDFTEGGGGQQGSKVLVRSNDCPTLCLARLAQQHIGLAACATGGPGASWTQTKLPGKIETQS